MLVVHHDNRSAQEYIVYWLATQKGKPADCKKLYFHPSTYDCYSFLLSSEMVFLSSSIEHSHGIIKKKQVLNLNRDICPIGFVRHLCTLAKQLICYATQA
jgi:hypothetical protein